MVLPYRKIFGSFREKWSRIPHSPVVMRSKCCNILPTDLHSDNFIFNILAAAAASLD